MYRWYSAGPVPDVEHRRVLLFCINLSGQSVVDPRSEHVLQSIDIAVHCDRLCFEITETAPWATGRLHFFLHALRPRCQFAIDDFGIGLASYAYFREWR